MQNYRSPLVGYADDLNGYAEELNGYADDLDAIADSLSFPLDYVPREHPVSYPVAQPTASSRHSTYNAPWERSTPVQRANFPYREGREAGARGEDFSHLDATNHEVIDTPPAPRYPVRPLEAEPHSAGSTTGIAAAERPVRRNGAHRLPAPPTALRGRVAVIAVAAGAVVAAGQAAMAETPARTSTTSDVALAAGSAPASGPADAAGIVAPTTIPTAAGLVPTATSTGAPVIKASNSTAPQIVNPATPAEVGDFNELLQKGARFAQERVQEELAKLRPLFVLPASGTYTSGFGSRWGTLHAGVDIANSIGTPIYAVADGTVIDSGPAAGFGLWVRILHADGTITVYGHIDSSEVSVGQKVMAGDEIAKMGNRGQSTGPHLHFEVHLAGEVKIDPMPWLASRGISLGVERD